MGPFMKKEVYKNYSVEDFVENQDFQEWVKNPRPESDKFWKEYLEKYPAHHQRVKSARYILNTIGRCFDTAEKDVEQLKTKKSADRLKFKIADFEKRKWGGYARKFALIGLASSVMLIGGIFLLQKPKDVFYSTGNAKRMNIILPDSSSINLNANSSISYNLEEWNDGKRIVNLIGEAYFNVRRIPNGNKFRVFSGDVDVTVLGTAFNVKTRNNKSEIVLTEGDINLKVGDQKLNMDPGDFISYSNKDNHIEAKKVKALDYIAWKDGITIFNNSLLEVTRELESIFGIEFEFEDETLLERQVQISAPTDDISQALEILSLVYKNDIEIKRKGNKIFINQPLNSNL